MGAPFSNFAKKAVPEARVPSLVVNSGRPTNVLGKAAAAGGKGVYARAAVALNRSTAPTKTKLLKLGLIRSITIRI